MNKLLVVIFLLIEKYHNDCEILKKSMEGWGTDEKSIIDLTGKRSKLDRQEIAKTYKLKYNKDLLKDFESELSGTFQKIIIGLYMSSIDYDTSELHTALNNSNTNTILEILSNSDSSTLNKINTNYNLLYGNMANDINEKTSGVLNEIINTLLDKKNYSNENNYPDKLEKDLDILESILNNENEVNKNFIEIFCKRSSSELEKLSTEYKNKFNFSLRKIIEKNLKNEKYYFLCLFDSKLNIINYYANVIRTSLKGDSTSEQNLIRIVISREERDLKEIIAEYGRLYKKNLFDEINDEVSGDFKKTLLAIIGNN